MISRVQGKTLNREMAVARANGLSVLEKAMLKWAVIDPEDRVLDANIAAGLMAEYLRRNMQCEVCGISDQMEYVRQARSRLQNCDIVYAAPGDIPWLDNAFDTVLMKFGGEEDAVFHRMLTEASRVLRSGGQLILGTRCYPAAINRAWQLFSDESLEERHLFERSKVVEMLQSCSFEKITWQRTGLSTGVLIAWKRKPEVDEIRSAAS